LDIDRIKAGIKGTIGREIYLYDIVDSTNTIALELSENSSDGTVVIADSQRKGRGRLGRRWFSPPGLNLYLSIILKGGINNKKLNLLTFIASIACAHAIRRFSGLNVSIKWPNDLIISKKKLGGILTELKFNKDSFIAVVGIGINVNINISEFPEEIRPISTSLRNETGKTYSREDLIAEILNEFDEWYSTLKKDDKDRIFNEWKRLNITLGKKVKILSEGKTLVGIAEDIDENGFLLLKLQSCVIKKIISGDVKLINNQSFLP